MSPSDSGAYPVTSQPEGVTTYGFQWGPMEVTRMAAIEGRGRVVGINTPHHRCQLYVSEQGRSIRLWIDNVEVGRG